MFSQTSNLRDHEAQHVREKHVMTVDPGRRASQVFVKNRGRPSIREIDRKKSGSRVVAAVVDDAEEDDPEPVQIAKQGEMEETQENIERFIRETEPQEEEMVKISVVEAVDENAEEDEPPNKMPRRAEKT